MAVPESVPYQPEFRPLRQWFEDNAGSDTCFTLSATSSSAQHAIASALSGDVDMALVTSTALFGKLPALQGMVAGYQHSDAGDLWTAFSAVEWDRLSSPNGSFAVLGMVAGAPRFPAFDATEFKNAPDFASELETLREPGQQPSIEADAILVQPSMIQVC